MTRIEVKRGDTTINVPAKDLEWYEQRGYKKSTATRGRKPQVKKTTDE